MHILKKFAHRLKKKGAALAAPLISQGTRNILERHYFLSFSFILFHSLSFTFILLHSLSFTFIFFHFLSFSFIFFPFLFPFFLLFLFSRVLKILFFASIASRFPIKALM